MWLALLLLFGGDIDRNVVRRAIRTHRDEIERCYAAGLKSNPHLGGRFVVRISIAGTGRVSKVEVVESELGAPHVELCITSEIEKWQFPKFGAGDPVIITYPFSFVAPKAPGMRYPFSAGPDENLPDQLKPSDIQRGMRAIHSLVAACYAQFKVDGMVNVAVTIANTGRVSGVVVTGKFAGTPTGDCVAHAVERAVFPSFHGPSMAGIDYPLMLCRMSEGGKCAK